MQLLGILECDASVSIFVLITNYASIYAPSVNVTSLVVISNSSVIGDLFISDRISFNEASLTVEGNFTSQRNAVMAFDTSGSISVFLQVNGSITAQETHIEVSRSGNIQNQTDSILLAQSLPDQLDIGISELNCSNVATGSYASIRIDADEGKMWLLVKPIKVTNLERYWRLFVNDGVGVLLLVILAFSVSQIVQKYSE